MAGNQAEFNNYLRDVLFFENQDVRTAINEQGITWFDDLTHRSDKYIQELFQKIRNPGGLVPNPDWQQPAAGAAAPTANVPQFIPNRGVAVGVNLELRFRQLRYYVFHQYRIQRTFVTGQATLARLEAVWALHERIQRMKESEKESLKVDALLKVENVRKLIEDIDEAIAYRLGAYGAPMSYLTRASVAINDETDPGVGLPDALSELVRRTRHTGNQYEEDNMSLWMMIRQATHGGPAWNWVKPFANRKDGRGAYLALKTHYMGRSFQKRNIANAERVLETVFFDGKARNFTFEMYCEKLNMAFQDLEEAGEPASEDRKVRILLANIRADELKSVVSRIRGDPNLEGSFETAMNHLAEQHDIWKQIQAKQRGASRNISAVGRVSEGKAKSSNKIPKAGNKTSGKGLTRYYSRKEWFKLSKEKQEEIRNARQQQQAAKRNASAVETNGSISRTDDQEPSVSSGSVGNQMSRRN
jgi:hypothetical protein